MKKDNFFHGKRFRIFVSGNELVEEDSLPLKILPKLKKNFQNIDFLSFDPTEDFPDEKNLIIIDTVINTNKIIVLKNPDLDKLSLISNYSLHDYDLAMHLKLMRKLGKLNEVTIIGIPPESKVEEKEILNDLGEIISNLPLKNE